ncbi:hypothetical protein X777_06125 [Ooceraea biroi]|uniref:Uncharacterized protein n=1 Tax=Ooceraea biroi TaxID=2015173 RepID=A0A026WDT7_OOCBI|nr:hypothetical protein X777_06125 [Ooceraea biroi]
MNSRGRSSREEKARGYARLKRGIIAIQEEEQLDPGDEEGRRESGLSVHHGTAALNYERG